MDIKSLRRADKGLWKLKTEIKRARKGLDNHPDYHNILDDMEHDADRAIEYVADMLRLENVPG